MRWVLVKLPSFSTWLAAGRKNTSTGESAGASCQTEADSTSTRSRTTSHSSPRMASRWRPEWAEPTAGFSPSTKKPWTVPSFMPSTLGYVEWLPSTRGRRSKPKSLSGVAASPNQAFSRLVA